VNSHDVGAIRVAAEMIALVCLIHIATRPVRHQESTRQFAGAGFG
jgi:hypothetical protein